MNARTQLFEFVSCLCIYKFRLDLESTFIFKFLIKSCEGRQVPEIVSG